MKWRFILSLMVLTAAIAETYATPGDLDLSFDSGSTIDGPIGSAFKQPDGKWIITGGFTVVNGFERHNIARLNSDGSVDPTFQIDFGPYSIGLSGALFLPNGKFYVFGNFSQVNGAQRRGIARLNVDGTLDETFMNNMEGANAWTSCAALLPDGKILIGGHFSRVNDIPISGFARLNNDGSVDTSYSGGGIDFGGVDVMAIEQSGRVILSGSFSKIQGVTRNRLARVHANGLLDTSYALSSEPSSPPTAILPLSNGSSLVGGSFTYIGGGNGYGLVRLTSSGRMDFSFGSNWSGTLSSAQVGQVRAILPQSDGNFIIAGAFARVNGTPRQGLAKISATGQVDPVFGANFSAHREDGSPGGILSASSDGDGAMLVGTFTKVNGSRRRYIARMTPDAAVDTNFFNPRSGLDKSVTSLAIQSATGKILVAGGFDYYSSTPQRAVARLNLDGSLDTSFKNPLTNYPGSAAKVAVAPNGKIYVAGGFGQPSSIRQGLARLSADGVFEAWAMPALSSTDMVTEFAIQSDLQVVIATSSRMLHRVTASGDYDTGFSSSVPAGAIVNALALLPNRKILVGGSIPVDFRPATPLFTRLFGNGAPDSTFAAGLPGPDGEVTVIKVHGDKILIGGSFTTFHGQPASRIARLNSDGTLDTTFTASTPDGTVVWILPQSDGKILYGEEYASNPDRIGRLNADGSVDSTFRPVIASTMSAALQADGRLVMGGHFTSIHGVGRDFVARLWTSDPPRVNTFSILGEGKFRLSATTDAGAAYIIQSSRDVAEGWTEFTRGNTADGSISLDLAPAEPLPAEALFFRILFQ